MGCVLQMGAAQDISSQGVGHCMQVAGMHHVRGAPVGVLVAWGKHLAGRDPIGQRLELCTTQSNDLVRSGIARPCLAAIHMHVHASPDPGRPP